MGAGSSLAAVERAISTISTEIHPMLCLAALPVALNAKGTPVFAEDTHAQALKIMLTSTWRKLQSHGRVLCKSLHQLPCNLFFQNLLHRQGDDYFVLGREVALDFGQGVGGEVERDEEALGAVGAVHGRLEGVDVGAAGLVLLLDLDGIPRVHEVQLSG